MNNLTGATFGQYTLLEQIGGGGMATVYKAYQPRMDRFVALKVVRADISADPRFRERFDREARTIARLEHRYILPVYDFGEAEGVPYLVMRYTNNGTLGDIIAHGPLTPPRAIRYIGQVAEALAYTHARNIIHRDIKPANVLLGPDDHVLLTDFGIAKMVAGVTAMTADGAALGTPYYMAPEQIRAQPVDARTDIYALGIVLYECLVGEPPFVAETPWAVLDMHVREPLPPPRAGNPAIGEALELALLRATNKDPADRFQTAEDFAVALNAAIEPGSAIDAAPKPHSIAIGGTPPPAAQPTAEPSADIPPAAPTTVLLTKAVPTAPPADTPPAAKRRRIPVWAWAVLAVALVAAVIGYQLLPTSQPTLISSSPQPTPLFADTFAGGSAEGWYKDPESAWTVVKDESGAFVYQGWGPATSGISSSSNRPTTQQLGDYAVELRARVINRATAPDAAADFLIALRANEGEDRVRTGGCESDHFLFNIRDSRATLARSTVSGTCGDWTELAQHPYSLATNTWYTIRAEARGAHLKLLIDGKTVLEGDDPKLTHGFFYLGVDKGATVQFADIRVLSTQ